MQPLIKFVNDARNRSILAGALGGFIGWVVAEFLVGTPGSFIGTLFIGLLAGAGIGVALASAEGVVAQNWTAAKRGALIGLLVGACGGLVGAIVGQVGYSVTAGATQTADGESRTRSVFSAEMQERLQSAGAKAGELEIGLLWENRNDLDLHVVDPDGERIFYQRRFARSGGELDVDRNAGCSENLTAKPVEHVVWPEGRTPLGKFQIYVDHYQKCGSSDPTNFRVEIIMAGKSETLTGSISAGQPATLVKTLIRTDAVETATGSSGGFGAFLARIFSWLMFGALVGCAQGAARRSSAGVRNAAIGGAVGGALGGLVFELISYVVLPMGGSDAWCRFLGFVALGACIGLFVVVVERALSATLVITTGRFEGREVYLDGNETRLGRADHLEVFLGGDPSIKNHHATIRCEGGSHVLVAAEGPVDVNATSVKQQKLQDGDRITIGATRLMYKSRRASTGNGPQPGSQPAAGGTAMPKSSHPTTASIAAPPPPPKKKKRN